MLQGITAACLPVLSLCLPAPLTLIEPVQRRLRWRDGPSAHSVPDPVITLPKIEQCALLILTAGNLNCTAAICLLL